MPAFRSEQELKTYLQELAEKQRRELRQMHAAGSDSVAVTAGKSSADKDESVTNVQHSGVDEGGIVKLHGNHLVVLRRGRLFTIAVGDGALKPVSVVDAFGPNIDPRNTWYDEMLVSEDTIAVIGYSYERGGTEVGLFKIDSQGNLTYQSTYHLRSNDYYSSRNYASRLIGNKLIFYTPLYLNPGAEDPFQSFPAVRKWRKGATNDEFRRIVSPSRVYRPQRAIESPDGIALHTVTVCDLSNGGFACEATSVIGPWGRVFYVSPQAVYVWVTEWVSRGEKVQSQSMLYRMPLDGSAPSALTVSGSPVDQFSFLESGDGNLNVLVRSDGAGDTMWNAEKTAGDVALMRVPLANFSDGSDTAAPSCYRSLPESEGYAFQNRFVGEYLLYGSGSGWDYSRKADRSSLHAVRWAGGEPHKLSLAHGVDRIEALGSDAIVVGTDGNDLHFTAIRLGDSPEVRDRYTRKGASQGELRSHGFFYKADDSESGVLGLPISTPGRPGYRHLFEGSVTILFLRNTSLHFEEIGELAAKPEKAADDACRASCVDWYGNARPLFVRGRILALMGYEIVEGSFSNGRMRELRRVSYAPTSKR
ncbi:MAG TPA: beta-propeller domain-containing protein [Blastocatellia bacterium]|nr:beta-propeller domain-containing protein [Blastocatellia bacterium]